jgi:hypothetical protein
VRGQSILQRPFGSEAQKRRLAGVECGGAFVKSPHVGRVPESEPFAVEVVAKLVAEHREKRAEFCVQSLFDRPCRRAEAIIRGYFETAKLIASQVRRPEQRLFGKTVREHRNRPSSTTVRISRCSIVDVSVIILRS